MDDGDVPKEGQRVKGFAGHSGLEVDVPPTEGVQGLLDRHRYLLTA
jgi:hypothetical protein